MVLAARVTALNDRTSVGIVTYTCVASSAIPRGAGTRFVVGTRFPKFKSNFSITLSPTPVLTR